jgi:hypothetical protein
MSTAVVAMDAETELTATVHAEHEACRASLKTSLLHAINCGEALRKLRVHHIPHGDWGAWLDANFPKAQRTAQLYMELADAHPQDSRLIEETDGSIQAAIGWLGKQLGGTVDVNLDEPEIVDAEVVPEPTYKLTLSQLTSLACKRWHRPPTEKEVLAWLKDSGLV